jgi:hypothetical protein
MGSPGVRQLTINFSILELSCGNLIIKEQVDFTKGAILGLGQAEPTPDIAEKVGSGVKESGFSSPVPGYDYVSNVPKVLLMAASRALTNRRKHARCNGIAENSSEVVHKPANDDRLVSQSTRGRFGHDGVTSRSDGNHIAQCRDD